MISEYILIIILGTYRTSSSTIPFPTRAKCFQYKETMIKELQPTKNEVIECFKKIK